MGQKVFVTGVTGKSGQYFFNECKNELDGHHFTFLVRNSSKAEKIKKMMPQSEVLIGSLEDKPLIDKMLRGGVRYNPSYCWNTAIA